MANLGLVERSAFSSFTPVQRPNIAIERIEALTVASIAVGQGQHAALNAVMQAEYAVTCPEKSTTVHGSGLSMMWAGPDQWIAFADRTNGRDLERELKAKLAGIAAVVDQTDARAIVRVSGPRARDVLAKGLPIDLHPSVFKTGDVAISHASHIGVIVRQVDDAPTYDLAMFRSFADSFMHWLLEASAEYLG